MESLKNPKIIDGIKAFAPELAYENDGFDSESFQTLFKLESNNFWFRVRNRIIIDSIFRHSKNPGNYLEIGCGTGYVLQGISKQYTQLKCHGSEIYLEGLHWTSERLPDCELFQMDARDIPFSESFDMVGAYDVLEHIDEDEVVLQQIYKALKREGILIITVPQHQFLWGPADEYAHHKRRYSRRELKTKLKNAGFEIEQITSFVTLLFPVMLLSRLFQNSENYKPDAELLIHPVINKLFEWILDFDRFLIKIRIPLFFGGSLLVVARKSNQN